MASKKRFKFGIIGAGTIGEFHAKAIKAIPNAELVYMYGRNFEKTTCLAEQYQCTACENYSQMLADNSLDIVTIATPSGLHYQPTLDAIGAICPADLNALQTALDELRE